MTKARMALTERRKVDALEAANIVGAHPGSLRRFIKDKPNFPKPFKLHNKNWFWADELETYVEDMLRTGGKAA